MSRRQAVNTIPACPPDEGLLMRGSWLIESQLSCGVIMLTDCPHREAYPHSLLWRRSACSWGVVAIWRTSLLLSF